MKELIGTVDLLNRLTGQFEPAVVYQDIDEKNFEDFEQHWKPLINARLASISYSTEISAANIQDWHWDWRAKARSRTGQLASESFAIEAGGSTQGLMLVNSAAFARLQEQDGLDVVYVDYLAAAPWNRKGFTPTPLYKGVGRILLVTAISLSEDLGFHGRIALHSLPQSQSWYRDECGMTDMGADPGVDPPGVLHYFEMTVAQAKFLTSP